MKKILSILFAVFILSGCYEKDHISTITYRIYYPGNTVTKTYTYNTSEKPCYILSSDRGSNYLYVFADDSWPYWGQVKLEDTSAPIEVVSITKKKRYE